MQDFLIRTFDRRLRVYLDWLLRVDCLHLQRLTESLTNPNFFAQEVILACISAPLLFHELEELMKKRLLRELEILDDG